MVHHWPTHKCQRRRRQGSWAPPAAEDAAAHPCSALRRQALHGVAKTLVGGKLRKRRPRAEGKTARGGCGALGQGCRSRIAHWASTGRARAALLERLPALRPCEGAGEALRNLYLDQYGNLELAAQLTPGLDSCRQKAERAVLARMHANGGPARYGLTVPVLLGVSSSFRQIRQMQQAAVHAHLRYLRAI